MDSGHTTDKDYRSRLAIAVDKGNAKTKFYTSTGLHVATGYLRVVIGARGPYIEFDKDMMIEKNWAIPKTEEWRIESKAVFFVEFRSIDSADVMLYFQKRTVDYADYKVGKMYVSPFDLYLKGNVPIITKKEKKPCRPSGGLFTNS